MKKTEDEDSDPSSGFWAYTLVGLTKKPFLLLRKTAAHSAHFLNMILSF